MIDRREILLGGLMIGASGTALLARQRTAPTAASEAALEAALPNLVNNYRAISAGDVILPQRDQLSEQVYDRYVVRGYGADTAADLPIRLVIAYGSVQDYGLQLHRPESCYPAAGFRISNVRTVALTLRPNVHIRGVALTAVRSGRREQILYWTRIGREFPTTLWAGRLVLLREALRRDIVDGVLVRLSMLSANPDAAVAAMAVFNEGLCRVAGAAAQHIMLADA